MNTSSSPHSQSLDIYRKTVLRYLGYFGFLGKIPVIPGNLAKTVAMSYMVSDVADKSKKFNNQEHSRCKRFLNASDAIIWQTVSSILIPGLLIKSLSEQAQKLKVNRRLPVIRSGALPYILGIALISFLSHPIDRSVNYAMDNTYRKFFKGNSRICPNVLLPRDYTFSDKLPLNREMDGLDELYKEMDTTPYTTNGSSSKHKDQSDKEPNKGAKNSDKRKTPDNQHEKNKDPKHNDKPSDTHADKEDQHAGKKDEKGKHENEEEHQGKKKQKNKKQKHDKKKNEENDQKGKHDDHKGKHDDQKGKHDDQNDKKKGCCG